MNLSQILNPPGTSATSLPDIIRHQARTPSPTPPQHSHTPSAASLSTFRLEPCPPTDQPLATTSDNNSNNNNINSTSSKSTLSSRKHANSVSVDQLEKPFLQSSSTLPSGSNNTPTSNNSNHANPHNNHNVNSNSSTASTNTGSNNSSGRSAPQKIKPNETNNGYSTHTFRTSSRTPPVKEKAASTSPSATGTSAGAAPAPAVGTSATGAAVSSTQEHPAKKRPRTQGEAGSFQSHPPEQDSKSSGTKKKTGKKSTALASSGNDTSEQLEIRFVMADKDGLQQEKDKARNPTPATTTGAHTATGPGLKTGPTGSISTSNSNSTPQTSDPSHCTSEELTMIDQDTAGSSPVPDFEKNADGKYRCSWPRCGKEFTVASRLTTHFRIHSGKPPYLCGYKDCQKAFHTSSSLSHHRVVHTDQGLRPYVCRHNRCGATYTQLARLITHQRTTHSGMILFIPQESPSSSTTIPATSSSSSSSSSSSASSSVPNPNPSTASLPGTIPNTATVAGANPTNGASDPATATEGMPTQARPTPASPARKEQTSSAKPKNDGGSSPPITHPTPPQQTNSTPPTAQTSAAYAKEPSPFQHQRPGQTTAGVSAMTSENPNGPLTPSLSKHREGHESVNHLDNGNRGGKENGEEEESEEMRQKKEAALAMTSLHEVTLHSRPSTAFDAPPSAAAATGTSQYRPHPPPPQPLPSSATSAQPEPPSHDSSLPSRYPPYDYHPQLPAPPAPPGQHSYHTDYLAENSNSRYHRHGPPPPVILPGTAPQQSPHPPPPAGPPPPYPARPSAGYWDSGAERDKHVQEYGWEPDRDRHYPSSMPTPSQTQTQSQRPFMNEGRYFGSDPPTNGPPHAPLHHTKPLQGQNSGSHNPYHGYD